MDGHFGSKHVVIRRLYIGQFWGEGVKILVILLIDLELTAPNFDR